MRIILKNNFKSIAIGIIAMLFFSCVDTYKKVGAEAASAVYPKGVAQNFELTYTEGTKELKSEDSDTSKKIIVLTGPTSEDFGNQRFPHQTFPDGLQVVFFDEKEQKSTVTADYGISYSRTKLIELRGNVVVHTHDGKILETPQLYYDRINEWIFTQNEFTFTNPEEGTVMSGVGMDFDKDFNFLNAHKTTGLIAIKEEQK